MTLAEARKHGLMRTLLTDLVIILMDECLPHNTAEHQGVWLS
jgi:hypothetical protein